MPVEFNHIDEFFRAKEEESSAPDTTLNAMQDKHWQQMENLLATPSQPAAKIRTLHPLLYGQVAAAVVLFAVTAFLLLNRKTERSQHPDIAGNITINANGNKNAGGTALPDRAAEGLSSTSIASVAASASSPNSLKRPAKNTATAHVRRSSSQKHPAQTNLNASIAAKGKNRQGKNISNKINNNNPNNSTAAVAQTTAPDARKVYNSFFNSLKDPDQQFQVNAARDTTIHCEKGTTIFIPAGAFVTGAGGPANGVVTVSVREAYSFADIVANKLTTLSANQEIETAGMLYIAAALRGEALQIRSGSNLRLNMPAEKTDPHMQLFTGEVTTPGSDSTATDQSIDWTAAGQQQMYYKNQYKKVTVLNLTDNPYDIHNRHPFNPSKVSTVAKFMIPWYCTYSTEFIKEQLQKKYGRFYDDIRVKREWKPIFHRNRLHDNSTDWYESEYVGDTVQIMINIAMRLHYITRADSLAYEAKWKAEMENALKAKDFNSNIFDLGGGYRFTIEKLGWINCDAFMGRPKNMLTDMLVSLDQDVDRSNFHTVLIFKKRNAILPGYWSGGRLQFRKIGTGEEVSIVCIGVRNGKPYAGIREVVTGETKKVNVQLTEVTPEELKSKLQQFGTVSSRS